MALPIGSFVPPTPDDLVDQDAFYDYVAQLPTDVQALSAIQELTAIERPWKGPLAADVFLNILQHNETGVDYSQALKSQAARYGDAAPYTSRIRATASGEARTAPPDAAAAPPDVYPEPFSGGLSDEDVLTLVSDPALFEEYVLAYGLEAAFLHNAGKLNNCPAEFLESPEQASAWFFETLNASFDPEGVLWTDTGDANSVAMAKAGPDVMMGFEFALTDPKFVRWLYDGMKELPGTVVDPNGGMVVQARAFHQATQDGEFNGFHLSSQQAGFLAGLFRGHTIVFDQAGHVLSEIRGDYKAPSPRIQELVQDFFNACGLTRVNAGDGLFWDYGRFVDVNVNGAMLGDEAKIEEVLRRLASPEEMRAFRQAVELSFKAVSVQMEGFGFESKGQTLEDILASELSGRKLGRMQAIVRAAEFGDEYYTGKAYGKLGAQVAEIQALQAELQGLAGVVADLGAGPGQAGGRADKAGAAEFSARQAAATERYRQIQTRLVEKLGSRVGQWGITAEQLMAADPVLLMTLLASTLADDKYQDVTALARHTDMGLGAQARGYFDDAFEAFQASQGNLIYHIKNRSQMPADQLTGLNHSMGMVYKEFDIFVSQENAGMAQAESVGEAGEMASYAAIGAAVAICTAGVATMAMAGTTAVSVTAAGLVVDGATAAAAGSGVGAGITGASVLIGGAAGTYVETEAKVYYAEKGGETITPEQYDQMLRESAVDSFGAVLSLGVGGVVGGTTSRAALMAEQTAQRSAQLTNYAAKATRLEQAALRVAQAAQAAGDTAKAARYTARAAKLAETATASTAQADSLAVRAVALAEGARVLANPVVQGAGTNIGVSLANQGLRWDENYSVGNVMVAGASGGLGGVVNPRLQRLANSRRAALAAAGSVGETGFEMGREVVEGTAEEFVGGGITIEGMAGSVVGSVSEMGSASPARTKSHKASADRSAGRHTVGSPNSTSVTTSDPGTTVSTTLTSATATTAMPAAGPPRAATLRQDASVVSRLKAIARSGSFGEFEIWFDPVAGALRFVSGERGRADNYVPELTVDENGDVLGEHYTADTFMPDPTWIPVGHAHTARPGSTLEPSYDDIVRFLQTGASEIVRLNFATGEVESASIYVDESGEVAVEYSNPMADTLPGRVSVQRAAARARAGLASGEITGLRATAEPAAIANIMALAVEHGYTPGSDTAAALQAYLAAEINAGGLVAVEDFLVHDGALIPAVERLQRVMGRYRNLVAFAEAAELRARIRAHVVLGHSDLFASTLPPGATAEEIAQIRTSWWAETERRAGVLIPSILDVTGEARVLSIDDVRWVAQQRDLYRQAAGADVSGDDFEAARIIDDVYAGIAVADTSADDLVLRATYSAKYPERGIDEDFTRPPDERVPGLRTVDHHGPYGKHPDGTPDPRDATQKLLDIMERALEEANGNADAAAERLLVSAVATDNLGDAMWCTWILRHQQRVLRDPALRALIRAATQFEDFTAFGTEYDANDPAVVLQAAIFKRFNQIVRDHNIVGGMDRFTSQQAGVIADEACAHIDAMLADPTERELQALEFWDGVDNAVTRAREQALIADAGDPALFNVYDMDPMQDLGLFERWLAIPRAHDLNLQVTTQKGAVVGSDKSGVGVSSRKFLVAVPNGRALPSGKSLMELKFQLEAAEQAKAKEMGVTLDSPTLWLGREAVIFPVPGSLLTPQELAAILADPRNGLFNTPAGREVMAPRSSLSVASTTDANVAPNLAPGVSAAAVHSQIQQVIDDPTLVHFISPTVAELLIEILGREPSPADALYVEQIYDLVSRASRLLEGPKAPLGDASAALVENIARLIGDEFVPYSHKKDALSQILMAQPPETVVGAAARRDPATIARLERRWQEWRRASLEMSERLTAGLAVVANRMLELQLRADALGLSPEDGDRLRVLMLSEQLSTATKEVLLSQMAAAPGTEQTAAILRDWEARIWDKNSRPVMPGRLNSIRAQIPLATAAATRTQGALLANSGALASDPKRYTLQHGLTPPGRGQRAPKAYSVMATALQTTTDPDYYRAVIQRLTPAEHATLSELQAFMGLDTYLGVMTNPSLLFSTKKGDLTKLKIVLATLDLYRGADGKIDPTQRATLQRYFSPSGKNSFSRLQIAKHGVRSEVDEQWGLVQEFALMSQLKFSSDNPDAFVVGEEGRLAYKYGERLDVDGFDIPRRTIHEAKNAYGTIKMRPTCDQLEKYGETARKSPQDVTTIEYDFVVYDNGNNNTLSSQLLTELSQRIAALGLRADQRVVVRLFSYRTPGAADPGGSYQPQLQYTFDRAGHYTLTAQGTGSQISAGGNI